MNDCAAADNPLLAPWNDCFGLPPFAEVRAEHFAPALEVALAEHRAQIDAIAGQTRAPEFDNTVAALDASGRQLARVEALLRNLCASHTTPALQAVEREWAPRLAAHHSAILLDARLFARIDAVHGQRDSLGLSAEQRRLVERVHLDCVLAGARLAPAARARIAQIVEEHAELTTRFAQNVLHDESTRCLWLRREADLDGLPPFLRAAAAAAAEQRRADEVGGDWAITAARSLVVPFLTFSTRRDLRQQAYRLWKSRGAHEGGHDNRPLARRILALRQEQARLHGYANYAELALVDRMAGTPAAVRELLLRVWQPAKERALDERAELQQLARADGIAAIEPWDWRYYAQRLRAQRYRLDEAELKPYFSLERMLEAAFDVAGRLFGLRFIERPQIETYHPDVRAFEVRRSECGQERIVGLFLSDNFARPGKRSGAWMSAYRWQSRRAGSLPIIVNNNNFAHAPAGEPTLLSFDDVRTLFHEFGHGLHGLLSEVDYERLSGTRVLRDFVELPSQLYEHWALEPAVLKVHARHAHTGAPIPDDLLARLRAARHFNQGFETVGYTACALLDLALHERSDAGDVDLDAFENEELARLGLPPGASTYHRLPHFQHLFSSSAYAAGYYVYLWAEVLDADGFGAFEEAGDPFHAPTAQRLHRHIYATGGSVEPMAAYRAFRGRDPKIEPLLAKRGLPLVAA
jgi:peptidyl-dipeptidase Dcp